MNLSPHIKAIMDRMSIFVGLNSFYDVDTNDPGWFSKHTWTPQTEKEFKVWLIDYLSANKEAVFELTGYYWRKDKKRIVKLANEVIFMWGWKTTKE